MALVRVVNTIGDENESKIKIDVENVAQVYLLFDLEASYIQYERKWRETSRRLLFFIIIIVPGRNFIGSFVIYFYFIKTG